MNSQDQPWIKPFHEVRNARRVLLPLTELCRNVLMSNLNCNSNLKCMLLFMFLTLLNNSESNSECRIDAISFNQASSTEMHNQPSKTNKQN